jgi:hypothetical protein
MATKCRSVSSASARTAGFAKSSVLPQPVSLIRLPSGEQHGRTK